MTWLTPSSSTWPFPAPFFTFRSRNSPSSFRSESTHGPQARPEDTPTNTRSPRHSAAEGGLRWRGSIHRVSRPLALSAPLVSSRCPHSPSWQLPQFVSSEGTFYHSDTWAECHCPPATAVEKQHARLSSGPPGSHFNHLTYFFLICTCAFWNNRTKLQFHSLPVLGIRKENLLFFFIYAHSFPWGS